MARRHEQRKLALLAKLSTRRIQIASQYHELKTQIQSKKQEVRDKMNVPKQVKHILRSSVENHPTKWFLGSTLGSLILFRSIIGKKQRRRDPAEPEIVAKQGKKSLLSHILFTVAKRYAKNLLIEKGKESLLKTARKRGWS